MAARAAASAASKFLPLSAFMPRPTAAAMACVTCHLNKCPFETLGVAPKFNMDKKELSTKYKQLAAQWHPDKFVKNSKDEQQKALDNCALLNEAYTVLQDPRLRAQSLLSKLGRDTISERSATVDAQLLMEVMEARETLDSASTEADVREVYNSATRVVADTVDQLGVAFERNDLNSAESLTIRLQYYDKIVEEAKTKLTEMSVVV